MKYRISTKWEKIMRDPDGNLSLADRDYIYLNVTIRDVNAEQAAELLDLYDEYFNRYEAEYVDRSRCDTDLGNGDHSDVFAFRRVEGWVGSIKEDVAEHCRDLKKIIAHYDSVEAARADLEEIGNHRDFEEFLEARETTNNTEEEQTMNIIETMTREERREAIRKTESNRDHLIAIYQTGISPASTVAELIGRIGYEAARQTIAEAVNARGEWDGRVSDSSRAWAAAVEGAADRETLIQHYLVSDAIHPAHVDQIAQAAAEYDRTKPDTAYVYDLRRIRWYLLRAIATDNQSGALNVCLLAAEAHTRRDISAGQYHQIVDLYDAWERGWCALEDSLAEAEPVAEEAETAPAADPDEVKIEALIDDLNLGAYADCVNDYRDSSAYICDMVAEIADNHVSLYYSDILRFISDNPDSLADVIEEGLYDPSHQYNLYAHAQAAQYMLIERDLYDHLIDGLVLAALDFIRYDLKREAIPGDLADLIRDWCIAAADDTGERMNAIPDRIREYFGQEGGSADA